jgi:hypothetical protein
MNKQRGGSILSHRQTVESLQAEDIMKDKIVALLKREDKLGQLAITTAIVRLYARQTVDERLDSQTKHTNSKGFSAAHCVSGSYMARYALGASRNIPSGISVASWDVEVEKLKRGERTNIRLIGMNA